ncbi:MAG TPA: crossover junction endodeoxyribonuclease RuvC [Anaeromyxobacteraceae bacterium]|nr:crossover junction endodeoxyribonuclease RuvC [Anaeromyxobacteraceae bacterium]
MVVLGIDPGSRRCGYGAVSRRGTCLSALASGVIVPAEAPLAPRLARIFDEISAVIARTRPDAVSVESAFCGASARSALVLGQARGVVLAAAARAGVPVFEYAPAEVKRAFTGSGRAEKVQMVRTARAIFGIDAELADEADALAVAVCHLASAPAAAVRPSRRGGPAVRARAATAASALRSSVRRYGSGA